MATVAKCKFDLEVCGGTFVDEPCVIDGNLISGRTYHDHGHYIGPWIDLLTAARPSRFPALRRAGEGTGGALAVSAGSSIIGFSFMALAPMPIFVTFGLLTAVMIFFSLLVSLLVLPSVLLVVTRSRTGAERQHFLDLTGIAPGEYDPHARETALHGQDSVSQD